MKRKGTSDQNTSTRLRLICAQVSPWYHQNCRSGFKGFLGCRFRIRAPFSHQTPALRKSRFPRLQLPTGSCSTHPKTLESMSPALYRAVLRRSGVSHQMCASRWTCFGPPTPVLHTTTHTTDTTTHPRRTAPHFYPPRRPHGVLHILVHAFHLCIIRAETI